MSDILKKPVHLAVLKPSHVQKLLAEGKLVDTRFGKSVAEKQPLPAQTNQLRARKLPQPTNFAKRVQHKTRLKVLYDNLPEMPADQEPPCDTCKTAACCRAFVVNITEMEYESGVYGDVAVKLTPEISKQLRGSLLIPMLLTAPQAVHETSYFLEGKVGEPCPFLGEDSRCKIYDIRPMTCRTYTCVDDDRITEGMRSGEEPITESTMLAKKLEVFAEDE